MFLSLFFLFGCVFLSTTEANFVKELQPCAAKDKMCLKDLVQNIIKHSAKDGFEEFKILPIENMVFRDIKVSSLNLINVTLVEGKVSKLQSCVVTDVDQQIEKGFSTVSLYCDMALKGRHRVEASPLLQYLFGSAAKIHGDGNFKLNIKKLQMTFTFYYEMVNRNGEIYFECHEDELRYKYDIEGVKVAADNIFLGNSDESQLIVKFVNENWRVLLRSFGNDFFDAGVKILENILQTYFNSMPAKYIVSDDLTSFAKTSTYE